MKNEDYNAETLIKKIKDAKKKDIPIYAADGPCGACDLIIGPKPNTEQLDSTELINELEKLDPKMPLYPATGNCGGCDICIPTKTSKLLTKELIETEVDEFFQVIISCMNPSTGYRWTINEIPNCVNLTNVGFIENMPKMPGSSGFQFFSFNAVTPTVTPPVMEFKLKSPTGDIVDSINVTVEIQQKA